MKNFTLIEVVLALLVSVVAVIGIMSLMPVGINKNIESIQRRSAADAADQFLHTALSKISVNWNESKSFPDTMSIVDESDIIWSEQNWMKNNQVDVKFSCLNSSDIFDCEVNNSGVFKISQLTNGNVEDFTGVIRAWKELIVVGDKRLNGDIMPWAVLQLNDGVGRGFNYGEEYQIKYNSTGNVSPGNFGCVNFSNGHGGGASQYQSFIENGGISASIGGMFYPETGNMVGPTIFGVNSRLSVTPYVRIPVVSSFPNGSSQQITIIDFLPFKLVSVYGRGNVGAEVRAIYVGQDSSGNGIARDFYKLVIKAEISWPENISYNSRNKEVYSVMMYKSDSLESF